MTEQAKHDLIKEVQKLGKSWDEAATKEALLFARKPDDIERKLKAQNALARSDFANQLADSVIDLIRKYWPT